MMIMIAMMMMMVPSAHVLKFKVQGLGLLKIERTKLKP